MAAWRIGVIALIVMGAGLRAQTTDPAAVVDVQRLGPQPGERVPDFALPDQFGQRRTLASLMGPKGLMLVFYRSADWCPYCKTQLADLQLRRAEISASGLGLAAISYDPPAVLRDFSARRGITFPLLSDAGSEVIRRYGILNTTIPETNRTAYGIPFPGTFIVGRDGRVESRMFAAAYQERFTANTVLLTLGSRLSVPVTTQTTPQLTVTTFATDAVVTIGSVFNLVLDGVPAAGMHVYAPGVTSYTPLSLDFEATPGLRVKRSAYPPSAIYHFAPLDERVPVYQQPFRLVHEAVVDAAMGGALVGETVIRATLRYQACSDSICFPPQELPLTWRLTVRPLDRERRQP